MELLLEVELLLELPEERTALLEERLEVLLPEDRTVEEEPLTREEPEGTREALWTELLLEEERTLRVALPRLTPLREAPLPKAEAERVLRSTLWRPLFSGRLRLQE